VSTFTVVGVWDESEAIPVGVIEGQHDVMGGDESHWEGGLWATFVEADDAAAAEVAGVEAIVAFDNA
jgi:hypothetical protein